MSIDLIARDGDSTKTQQLALQLAHLCYMSFLKDWEKSMTLYLPMIIKPFSPNIFYGSVTAIKEKLLAYLLYSL